MNRLSHPYVWIGSLALVAVALLAASERASDGSFLGRHGPNLFAEIFSILLGVVLIDRILRWNRERQIAPVKQVAVRRIRAALARTATLLAMMYKAAARAGSPKPTNLEELLQRWLHEVPRLDLGASVVPTTDPTLEDGSSPHSFQQLGRREPWLELISSDLQKVRDELTSSIDLYTNALSIEQIVAIDELVGDPIFMFLCDVNKKLEVAERVKREHGCWLALGSRRSAWARELFAQRVKAVAERFQSSDKDEEPRPLVTFDRPFPQAVWRSDVSPLWGTSRHEGALTERLTEFVVFFSGGMPRAGPRHVDRIYIGGGPRREPDSPRDAVRRFRKARELLVRPSRPTPPEGVALPPSPYPGPEPRERTWRAD